MNSLKAYLKRKLKKRLSYRFLKYSHDFSLSYPNSSAVKHISLSLTTYHRFLTHYFGHYFLCHLKIQAISFYYFFCCSICPYSMLTIKLVNYEIALNFRLKKFFIFSLIKQKDCFLLVLLDFLPISHRISLNFKCMIASRCLAC